jgi:UDP-N-acetylmuramoyl-L-alanyl-D-glutamate--2,6-diaminopimelate ligase
LFRSLGYKCGLISTVKYKIDNQEIPATHTTPDALQMNKLLRQMVDAGCKYCFTEVSSHSVVQHRITGLDFKVAVFSNITHDHLDYHGTFDNYIKAKKGFFDMLSSDAFALVNRDDKNAWIMLQNTKAVKKSYSLLADADYKAKVIESHLTGLVLNIDGQELWTKLIGRFNAYNLLAVYACAMLLKQDKMKVLTAISNLNSVEGRFQYVKSKNNITAVIDYAHTPDALLNVLKTIKEIVADGGNIITVVGCGGDRDAQKRPEMAKIACEWSNKVILTSDNPRSEEPEEIINQMKKGVEITSVKKTLAISDRREAIKTACALAQSGDIVLIAGKGHEKYQEIKGVKHPFDDVQEVTETFKTMELI